jgi:hypothetical protein
MSDRFDIESFVKDPGLLVKLCRDVIDRIDAGSADPNAGEKEAQLREIARTIERLEKMRVTVPDALRAEKTKLAAALGTNGDVNKTLRQLADDFEKIIINIRSRVTRENGGLRPKKTRTYAPRSTLPKKSHSFYRDYIINALRKFGGRARVADVLDEMEKQLNGKLLTGDLELRKDGKTVGWRNTAQWERFIMVKEGILRGDSPDGIWELSEGYR